MKSKPVATKSIRSVWVCGACGKRSNDRNGDGPIDRGWDVSCMLKAIERDPDSLKFGDDGRVIAATALTDLKPLDSKPIDGDSKSPQSTPTNYREANQ
jgi:hypothetical protein